MISTEEVSEWEVESKYKKQGIKVSKVTTGASLPGTANVPGKMKTSRNTGSSGASRASRGTGKIKVSGKAKAAKSSANSAKTKTSDETAKKKKLKAASASKAHATKVKKAKKVRDRVGLISFIKNRKAGRAMTRSEKLWLEIVVGTICVIYFGAAIFFHFHFLPRSAINGVDVSFDTVDSAKEKMVEHTEQYELTVRGVEGTSDEVISDKNLNLQFTQFDEVSDALHRQHGLLWPFISWVQKKDEINLNITYDTQALEDAMNRVSILNPEKFKPVKDAYVATDENGYYKVYPEEMGSEIKVDEAKEAIRKAVGKGLSEVSLEKFRIYPSIYKEDPGLKHREEQWNEYMKSEGLTYVLWNKDEMIFTPEVIGSLLIDNGSDISLDEEAVENLVMGWHLEYDTFDVPWEFTTHYGDTVTIDAGDYGWRMYVDDTTASVKSNLYAHTAGRYDVDYVYQGLYDFNKGLGDTYVEVSIGQQMMWIYNNGECVVETPVVTGTNTPDRMTTPGCYSVKYKDQSVILGTYEVNGYESYVNYWICFNGGQGIHDATWRSDFGGDIWLGSGSHGCVNTPLEVMPIVYDNVFDDHAVVLYL